MSAIILRASKIFTRGSRPVLGLARGLKSRHVLNTEDISSRYGGKTNITVLPGVGIGPEIMEMTLAVLMAARAPLTFEILTLSSEKGEEEADEKEFENILTSIRRNKVALKGNIEVKSRSPTVKSRNVLLRKTLDLFVYILRCKTFPNLRNKFGEFDVVVIRQNTEGEYLMLEHEPLPGTIENLKVITKDSSSRLAKFAFDYAQKNNRKHISVVHAIYIQKESEGLFLDAALEVSKDYPGITVDIVDCSLAAAKIIMQPSNFDVILASNLNGSILSNIMIGMMGGPGLTAGCNYGGHHTAVFEPGARNKGSSIVGKGVANPVAMILASINMLKYLEYEETALVLQTSLYNTLVKDNVRTQDLGGKASTKDFTDRVIFHVNRHMEPIASRESPAFWKKYCELPKDSSRLEKQLFDPK